MILLHTQIKVLIMFQFLNANFMFARYMFARYVLTLLPITLLQLMVDTATLVTGQNVRKTVKEESKQGIEPAQTLLLHTEELTV